jgi:hypothetical protein
MDYSAVLVTIKARSLSDIPHALAMYGFNGLGTIASVSIIRSQAMPGFQPGDDDDGAPYSDDDAGNNADVLAGPNSDIAPLPPPH